MKVYEINSVACLVLTKKHKPSYFKTKKLKVNSGLPAGRTYTLKEYQEFKDKKQIDIYV